MKKNFFAPTKLTVLLLSFLLPVGVLLAVYSAFGIYPFGDKSLLIMDLNGQSVDFYAYIRDLLCGESSLFYSFSKGLGGNMVGLLSYYGALPFMFLTALFPKENMQEAVLFVNLLLVGLSGLSMCIFLHSHKKEWNYSYLTFSVSYALMSYSILYSMQMQWLCGVLFLPLILLGINRMVEDGKWGTFVTFYTLLLLSNIYTGYMVTLFSGIYFFWKIISEKRKIGKPLLTFALAGVGSFALSAFWTVPAFLATMSGREGMVPFSPDTTESYGLSNVFMKFFMGQYDSITNTVPETAGTVSFYCGILILALALYYFFNRKISIREKVCSGIVLLIFGASVYFVALDKVWHLFSFPNWFPYRWAFLISFFLVFLAFRGFITEEKKKGNNMASAFAILAPILSVTYVFKKESFANSSLAGLTLIFFAVYWLLFPLKKRISQGISVAILLILCVEMGLSGLSLMHGLNRQFGYKDREQYVTSVREMETAVKVVEDVETSPFYRVEKTDLRSDNDAMNVGYFGMTHYSSSFDRNFNTLNNRLGMIQEWYASRYTGATPVIDSVFGVKYILSTFPPTDNYPVVAHGEKYTVYENPHTFPLGFMVQGNLPLQMGYVNDYLLNQNIFYQALTGNEVFTPVSIANDGNGIFFTVTKEKPVYLALSNKVSTVTVLRNGEDVPVRDTWETKVKLLGTFRIGDQIRVYIDGNNSATLGYLNEETLAQDASRLRASGLTVTDFKNTCIKGTVSTPTSGMMVTTIPYADGWSVKVDGEKVTPTCALETFLSFPLDSGEHEVTLTYRAPGMTAGIPLSLLALAVLIYLKKKKK